MSASLLLTPNSRSVQYPMLGVTPVLYFPLHEADLLQIQGNARCANTKAAMMEIAITSSVGVFSQVADIC